MLIAISGGIGCGKTVVSRIVAAMGYPVYDCDSRAARIMDTDAGIKNLLAERVHPECITPDGGIDRKRLGEIVFSNYEALQRLNSIVHEAVRRDLAGWYGKQTSPKVFVETAILYQSGLDKMVDEVWEIEAPLDVRVERVMARNGFDRNQVLARISSQEQFEVTEPHGCVRRIVNDSVLPVLPQVEAVL